MILTQTEQRLRDFLVSNARNGTCTYYEVAMAHMGLDVSDIDQRNQFGDMLDKVNRFEHDNERPMLTSVVIHKKDPSKPETLKMPGDGFFLVAQELKVKKIGDDNYDFWSRELRRTYDYWMRH